MHSFSTHPPKVKIGASYSAQNVGQSFERLSCVEVFLAQCCVSDYRTQDAISTVRNDV